MSAYESPFNPAYVSGLLAWYDAADLATITDAGGGAVSQWNDKSGNGYHLTQGTSGARPTTGTRTQNGRNVIDFDGSNDKLASSCPADDITSITFCVAKVDTLTSYRTLCGANGNEGDCMRINQTSGVLAIESQAQFSGCSTPAGADTTRPFIAVASWRSAENIGCMLYSASGGIVSLGAANVNVTWSSFAAGRTLVVGASNTTFFMDGWIGEILRYSTAMDGKDIIRLLQYLSHKWAV